MKRVLIIKMGALGDLLMATPMLTALHAAHPGIEVIWMVEDIHAEILRGNPLIARLLPFDSARWRRACRKPDLPQILRHIACVRRIVLRDGPLDALICCHAEQWWWGVLCLWLARKRIGLMQHGDLPWTGRFYSKAITRPQDPVVRNVEHYLLTTRALGCKDAAWKMLLPETEEEKPFLSAFRLRHQIDADCPWIVIAPFTTWKTKAWETERWAELIGQLRARHQARFIVTMADADQSAAQELAEQTPASAREALILAQGTTLREYIALIRHARLVISCDSSPLHIAAAVGTPYITLFGPTDMREIAPIDSDRKGVILCHPLPCSPCGQPQHCINPIFHACMLGISVADVVLAAESVLAGSSGRSIRVPLMKATAPDVSTTTKP